MPQRALIQFNYNNIIILYFKRAVNDPNVKKTAIIQADVGYLPLCNKKTKEPPKRFFLISYVLFFLSHIEESDDDRAEHDIKNKLKNEITADKTHKHIYGNVIKAK